ncbi:site-specific integrase [Nonomuraea sp. JJY05]|uniref:site-specific integrase n=1 Tax=Nonomuraea sp. JJY05 TaxID=3350255 RepID=UPI00373F0557
MRWSARGPRSSTGRALCPRPRLRGRTASDRPAEQTKAFLAYARKDRLFVLFRLIATRGLRRGEGVGLRKPDVNYSTGQIGIHWQITQLGWEPIQGAPKTDASDREIAVDAETMLLLKEHDKRQRRERLAAGEDWIESGFVFTHEIGRPLHPQHVTDRFYGICYQAGLPPIRLHDLRHGAATAMLAAGVDIKIVQETLGHTSSAFTRDTYTSIYPEAAAAAAEATAAFLTGSPAPAPRPVPPGRRIPRRSILGNNVDHRARVEDRAHQGRTIPAGGVMSLPPPAAPYTLVVHGNLGFGWMRPPSGDAAMLRSRSAIRAPSGVDTSRRRGVSGAGGPAQRLPHANGVMHVLNGVRGGSRHHQGDLPGAPMRRDRYPRSDQIGMVKATQSHRRLLDGCSSANGTLKHQATFSDIPETGISVWSDASGTLRKHPTQEPLALNQRVRGSSPWRRTTRKGRGCQGIPALFAVRTRRSPRSPRPGRSGRSAAPPAAPPGSAPG